MQMLDGKVVGLPANTQGMTVLPEISQESQWAVLSHPMEIPELCEFLMLWEQQRQQREGSVASAVAMMQAEKGLGGTYSSVQMPNIMAQSAMVAHNRLQSASSLCFDYNWNSQ